MNSKLYQSMVNIYIYIFIGGTPLREAIFEVKNGAEWIIGTPGRLLDLLKRGVLNLANLKAVILDEAD